MSSVSGVGAASTNSAQDSGTLGNTAPISFPGIASGIDYNTIIQKLTSLTLAQNKPLQTQLTKLSAQNTELIKINGLIQAVQDSISTLSDPALFSQFSATSSSGASTATQITGAVPLSGTTTILSQLLATSTAISSDTASNQAITGATTLGSGKFQITPNYSSTGQGSLTVNGTKITYTATSTISSVLTDLNAIAGVSATLTGNKITLTSTGQALSIGAASDQGNLASVFKFDTAPISQTKNVSSTATVAPTDTLAADGATTSGQFTINGQTVTYTTGETVSQLISDINATGAATATINGANKLQISTTSGALTIAGDTGDLVSTFGLNSAPVTIGSVTSAGPVGGFNIAAPLNTYGITGSTFSINGVGISFNPASDGLTNIISKINNSTAGVIAQFSSATGQIQLIAKATGPQSIVLGAPTDDTNFLDKVGLTSGGGFTPTTQVGSQSQVTYVDAGGNQQTVYGNSNSLTNVIPGITLNLQANTSVPYGVTVTSDSTNLVAAVNAFSKAYNTAINEINASTAAPVIQARTSGSPVSAGAANSAQLTAGGILYDNFSVKQLKNQLVNLTTNLFQTGSSSYNSLASIGLKLDTSVGVLQSSSTAGDSNTDSDNADSGVSVQTYGGTSGRFQALDVTAFTAALQANPTALQNLFTGSAGLGQQLGSYLTYVSGSPTLVGGLHGSFAAATPTVSLLQGIQSSNSSQIQSVNQQIQLVTDTANSQADSLRREFTMSEGLIAQLQQEQASLASFFGSSSSSSSS